jgi:hypothetical protein
MGDKKGKKNHASDPSTSRSRSNSRRNDKQSRRKGSKRDESASPPASRGRGSSDVTLSTVLDKFTEKFEQFSLDIKHEFTSFKTTLDKQEERLDKHDQMLADHDTKFQELFDAQKAHDERVSKSLEDANNAHRAFVAAAPIPATPAPRPSNSFDRDRRANALVANVQDNVRFQKSELETAFKTILADKGLDCSFDIPGPAVSQKFSVFFSGPVSEQIVLSMLRARKDSAGDWVNFAVKTPEGTQVKLYYGPDKSPKAVRLESISKKLAKHLEATYGGHSFKTRFDEGIISMDGSHLAFVEVTPKSAKLQWNNHAPAGSGISKDDVMAYFDKTFNVQWSS